MEREPSPENRARGYKASLHNPRVSQEAKRHAQHELEEVEKEMQAKGETPAAIHQENIKRGLRAAMHNPNVTQYGQDEARHRLEEMGEHFTPSDPTWRPS